MQNENDKGVINIGNEVLIDELNKVIDEVEFDDSQIEKIEHLDKDSDKYSDKELRGRFKAIINNELYVEFRHSQNEDWRKSMTNEPDVVKEDVKEDVKDIKEDVEVEDVNQTEEVMQAKERGLLPLGPTDDDIDLGVVKEMVDSDVKRKTDELLKQLLSDDEIVQLEDIGDT